MPDIFQDLSLTIPDLGINEFLDIRNEDTRMAKEFISLQNDTEPNHLLLTNIFPDFLS